MYTHIKTLQNTIQNKTDAKVMNANMVQLDNPIQGGEEGRVTMEPEACICPARGQ